MLWKLMTLWAILALGECKHFQYPATNSCVLLDVEMNITLTRNQKGNVSTYYLTGANQTSGSCRYSSRILLLTWAKDASTAQMEFTNHSDIVGLTLTFTFVPSKVWGNGSDEAVKMSGSLDVGHEGKSFICKSAQVVHLNTTQDYNVTYEADWSFMNFQVQAFGVENGTYSEAEHCAEDSTTAVPATTQTTTEHHNGSTESTTEHGTTEHHNITTVTTQQTTEHENGTTETTNSTTEPTTGTMLPTTSTAPPSSHPKNTYTFNDTNGQTCVRLQAEIWFEIPGSNSSESKKIGIPDLKEVNVSGDCNYKGRGLNMMQLNFYDNWTLTFIFANSKSNLSQMLGVNKADSFWWKNVTLDYTYDTTGKSAEAYTNFSGNHQFEADTDGSYMCNADTNVDMSNGVKMNTRNLQYYAFEKGNKTFPSNKLTQCDADSKTNSVVPIAVGAALAGLVVIVLIAYLIGRRRNRKGYESV